MKEQKTGERKEFKAENHYTSRAEEKMAKKHETGNFISLVVGIILIIAGLGGTAITISMKDPIIFAPIALLIIGAFLALMGGLREW